MAEEYFQGEVIAPKAYVGKMVHYYPNQGAIEFKCPSAALIAYTSEVAQDLYVFPDYTTSGSARAEYGRTYSSMPKVGHWTEIPEEAE